MLVKFVFLAYVAMVILLLLQVAVEAKKHKSPKAPKGHSTLKPISFPSIDVQLDPVIVFE